MRKMSLQRRRVVAIAGGLASMSGVGPVLLRRHPRAEWVWLGAYGAAMIWVIVLMVGLQREEGCE